VQSIRPHNQQAAAVWGAGGPDYDKVSEHTSDAIDHLVRRVLPQPGERFLDIATGTGWTARRLAACGADVVGIDLGAPVIEAAKTLGPSIDFRVGDSEALEFEDESFDGVTSTFGIMFAARPEDAAAELTRICRRGGRIGLLTWLPGGAVEGLFGVMRPYLPPPPSSTPPSPFAWGRPAEVCALLGNAFDLKFETGTTTLRVPAGRRLGICLLQALVRQRRLPLRSNPGGGLTTRGISLNIMSAFAVNSGSPCRASTSSQSG
jgi:SAM-dependent methyltransferase